MQKGYVQGYVLVMYSDVELESGNELKSDSSPYFSGHSLGPSGLGLSAVGLGSNCIITVLVF